MKLPIALQDHTFCGSIIVDGQGVDIARVDRAEDAAYIVNAVNNHAALVEALEEIVSWHWDGLRVMPGHVDWVAALEDIERASKALAAAKGENDE